MTNIPRKLGVDDLKTELAGWVMVVDIFLDGVQQKNCIRYDMDAGELERYVVDEHNKLVLDGHSAVTETVRGEITVKLRDGASEPL